MPKKYISGFNEAGEKFALERAKSVALFDQEHWLECATLDSIMCEIDAYMNDSGEIIGSLEYEFPANETKTQKPIKVQFEACHFCWGEV